MTWCTLLFFLLHPDTSGINFPEYKNSSEIIFGYSNQPSLLRKKQNFGNCFDGVDEKICVDAGSNTQL